MQRALPLEACNDVKDAAMSEIGARIERGKDYHKLPHGGGATLSLACPAHLAAWRLLPRCSDDLVCAWGLQGGRWRSVATVTAGASGSRKQGAAVFE